MAEQLSITERDNTYVAHTYGRFPLEIVAGEGSVAFDSTGKRYIDLGTGIAVNAFGYADPIWTKAVTDQLGKVQHTSNLYYTEPCSRLAELLCQRTGMKRVFFGNSGAEANECAIKVARKYGAKKGASTIITLVNSFHGRTLTTLSATGQDHYHELFQPLTPGFIHVPANDIAALETAITQPDVAGFLMECVQGEGGVLPINPEFAQAAEALCKENDVVFMVDEVQTGNGRSGHLYAYQGLGLHPDVVSTAKGLGAGLPIGACLMSEKVADVLQPGDHGSTFGGNPVCCAGAISVIERLTEDFLAQVRAKADFARVYLEAAPGVQEVSGMGLMLGVLPQRPAAEVVRDCMEKGVLCLTAKNKVRLLPALNIPDEQLKEALDILISCL